MLAIGSSQSHARNFCYWSIEIDILNFLWGIMLGFHQLEALLGLSSRSWTDRNSAHSAILCRAPQAQKIKITIESHFWFCNWKVEVGHPIATFILFKFWGDLWRCPWDSVHPSKSGFRHATTLLSLVDVWSWELCCGNPSAHSPKRPKSSARWVTLCLVGHNSPVYKPIYRAMFLKLVWSPQGVVSQFQVSDATPSSEFSMAVGLKIQDIELLVRVSSGVKKAWCFALNKWEDGSLGGGLWLD